MVSVQIIISEVFGALDRGIQCQAILGHLIHPDPGRNHYRALERHALAAGNGLGTSLRAGLPAGTDETVKRLPVLEDENQAELLDPIPRPAWTSIIFMKVSCSVSWLTAIPLPVPPPAKRIFMPKLLNTA